MNVLPQAGDPRGPVPPCVGVTKKLESAAMAWPTEKMLSYRPWPLDKERASHFKQQLESQTNSVKLWRKTHTQAQEANYPAAELSAQKSKGNTSC